MQKFTLVFTLSLFLGISGLRAQYNGGMSAIHIQLPISYRNAELSVVGQQLQINHKGSDFYIANLYPGQYRIIIKNGSRLIQSPILLQRDLLMKILVSPNGKLINQPLKLLNSNPFVVKDQNFPIDENYNRDNYTPYYESEGQKYPPLSIQKEALNDWLKEFHATTFDTKKVDYLRQTLNFQLDYKTAKDLLQSFDADYNRIKAAKILTEHLYNPTEAVGLIETFDHDSYKRDFQAYLKKY